MYLFSDDGPVKYRQNQNQNVLTLSIDGIPLST